MNHSEDFRDDDWGGDHDELRPPDGLLPVTCPTCFEVFRVIALTAEECPAQMDYDCEVCCRPMVIRYDGEGNAEALSLDDYF